MSSLAILPVFASWLILCLANVASHMVILLGLAAVFVSDAQPGRQ